MERYVLLFAICIVALCLKVTEVKVEEINQTQTEEAVKTSYNPIKTTIVNAEKPDYDKLEIVEVTDKKTIALLGSDTRIENGVGRSDAIVVLQLDPDNSKIQYVSIPRDTYTEIAGKGYKDKINHAMAYGVDYTVASLENLLEVKIDNYFTIDFHSFERIIDALGGVTVEVDKGFKEQNKDGKKNAIRIKSGMQNLTGEQALAYARMRKQDIEGDIGRAKRQQQIVESTLNTISDADTFKKMKIATAVLDEVDTDFEISEIPSYIKYIKKYKNTEKIVLTGRGMNIEGVYYMDLDDKELKNAINTLQGVENENYSDNNQTEDTKYDIRHKQY